MTHSTGQQRRWFKSKHSNGSCACVEVKLDGEWVSVRDTKFSCDRKSDSEEQPTIIVPASAWLQFLAAVAGAAAQSPACPLRFEPAPGGAVSVRSTLESITLTYTAQEWDAFVAGVKDGEFAPTLASA